MQSVITRSSSSALGARHLTRRATLLASALLAASLAAHADAQSNAPGGTSRVATPAIGGVATIRDTSPNAFGYPSPSLTAKQRRTFLVGNSFFKQNWIESPASASNRDGLGPLFNARSCSACHLRDGRSAPPIAGSLDRSGLLIRIGVRQPNAPDAPHPHYGGQVQDSSIGGVDAEARVAITGTHLAGRYEDGATYELLRPSYALENEKYGELGDGITLGPRVAPQLIGLGLLEAVANQTIEAMADADDTDGDGISGRVHYLDASHRKIGRFGWKATKETVRTQTAAAYVNDMGITSQVFPREVLTTSQRQRVATDEAEPDIRSDTFDKVVFYVQALAVPAQRDTDSKLVVRGANLFEDLGCAACHAPKLTTGDVAFLPSYRRQTIRPYTDLLLHDMGEGLADEKRDGEALPSEWRTPPLWGIGLIETVSGHTRYLHDGRARNLAEAILWHGGEGEPAKQRFRSAEKSERDALLAFLRSL